MRCIACNKNLSDFESTRKYNTGGYVDLCNHCWYSSQMYSEIPVTERTDLDGPSDGEEEVPIL